MGEARGHCSNDTVCQSFQRDYCACLERAKEVRVFNTNLPCHHDSSKGALEIAKKVDCMMVVGGYNSGNTQRLAAICREIQPRTYHIETAKEINPRWLAEKRDRVDRGSLYTLLDHQAG